MRIPVRPKKQNGEGFCGVESLRIAFSYWKDRLPEEDLVGNCPILKSIKDIKEKGVDEEKMADIAFYYKLSVDCKKHGTWIDLLYWHLDGFPIIVEWVSSRSLPPGLHYSVVSEIDRMVVELADPEFGDFYHLQAEDFLKLWNGWMLVIGRR